jgi:hypothetical protein
MGLPATILNAPDIHWCMRWLANPWQHTARKGGGQTEPKSQCNTNLNKSRGAALDWIGTQRRILLRPHPNLHCRKRGSVPYAYVVGNQCFAAVVALCVRCCCRRPVRFCSNMQICPALIGLFHCSLGRGRTPCQRYEIMCIYMCVHMCVWQVLALRLHALYNYSKVAPVVCGIFSPYWGHNKKKQILVLAGVLEGCHDIACHTQSVSFKLMWKALSAAFLLYLYFKHRLSYFSRAGALGGRHGGACHTISRLWVRLAGSLWLVIVHCIYLLVNASVYDCDCLLHIVYTFSQCICLWLWLLNVHCV